MNKRSILKYVNVMCIAFGFLSVFSCKQSPVVSNGNQYKVMTISLSDKSLSSLYSATMSGKQDVEIRPQVSGLITEVRISEGATVKKGQVLFVIDQVSYKAALQMAIANVEKAEANVATAQLTVDSKQELYNQKVVSAFDLQSAQNTLRSQKAALSQAKAEEINARNNLSYTEVKSPSDGIAGMIPYRVGALVSSSITTPLVTVSDDAEMNLYFSLTENQLLALTRQKGSMQNAIQSMPEVLLKLSDGSLYPEKGKIDAVSGIIDPSTGAISMRASFRNPDRILHSGGSGNIVLPYDKKDCIVIPQDATYEIQDKLFVYKVVDGKTRSTPVAAFSVNDGQEYIIESGLKAGDVIIAEGAGFIREGIAVSAVAADKKSEKDSKH